MHNTYSVLRVFRTPILGDKVPEQLMPDSVLQMGENISISNVKDKM
jgi:hypothetical protein